MGDFNGGDMRELKFRAWAVASRVMFYPDEDEGWGLIGGEFCPRPNTILMQYTGLKDEDNVKIYEGDIIRMYFNWCPPDNPYYNHSDNPDSKGLLGGGIFQCFPVEFHQGEVGACKGGNVMEWRLGKCHNLWNGPDVKVIGNIYENPELLKSRCSINEDRNG